MPKITLRIDKFPFHRSTLYGEGGRVIFNLDHSRCRSLKGLILIGFLFGSNLFPIATAQEERKPPLCDLLLSTSLLSLPADEVTHLFIKLEISSMESMDRKAFFLRYESLFEEWRNEGLQLRFTSTFGLIEVSGEFSSSKFILKNSQKNGVHSILKASSSSPILILKRTLLELTREGIPFEYILWKEGEFGEEMVLYSLNPKETQQSLRRKNRFFKVEKASQAIQRVLPQVPFVVEGIHSFPIDLRAALEMGQVGLLLREARLLFEDLFLKFEELDGVKLILHIPSNQERKDVERFLKNNLPYPYEILSPKLQL